jgi:hypothetical protein
LTTAGGRIVTSEREHGLGVVLVAQHVVVRDVPTLAGLEVRRLSVRDAPGLLLGLLLHALLGLVRAPRHRTVSFVAPLLNLGKRTLVRVLGDLRLVERLVGLLGVGRGDERLGLVDRELDNLAGTTHAAVDERHAVRTNLHRDLAALRAHGRMPVVTTKLSGCAS